jgi:hypothetical protein
MSRREDRYTTTEADAGEYERWHNMDAWDDDEPNEADMHAPEPLALTEGRVVEVPDLGGVWRAIGGRS